MTNETEKKEVLLALFLRTIESREIPQKGSYLHNVLSDMLRTGEASAAKTA